MARRCYSFGRIQVRVSLMSAVDLLCRMLSVIRFVPHLLPLIHLCRMLQTYLLMGGFFVPQSASPPRPHIPFRPSHTT